MTQTTTAEFQEDPPRVSAGAPDENDQLLLNIDGYEGPIDILLELSKKQKVDLTKISILQLARQYLEFVERAKALNLELAAEYLVMAAWLAYLKSRLLLPQSQEEDEPSAEEMAEALQFQLRRLEAMQKAGGDLMKRPQLGQEFFVRGVVESISARTTTHWDVSLYDLLRAYGDMKVRQEDTGYDLPEFHLMSTDAALERLTSMLGRLPKSGMKSVWATLDSFMPDDVTDPTYGRSALASTLTAGLELVKQGKLEIRQDGNFKPIYMRTTGIDGQEAQDE